MKQILVHKSFCYAVSVNLIRGVSKVWLSPDIVLFRLPSAMAKASNNEECLSLWSYIWKAALFPPPNSLKKLLLRTTNSTILRPKLVGPDNSSSASLFVLILTQLFFSFQYRLGHFCPRPWAWHSAQVRPPPLTCLRLPHWLQRVLWEALQNHTPRVYLLQWWPWTELALWWIHPKPADRGVPAGVSRWRGWKQCALLQRQKPPGLPGASAQHRWWSSISFRGAGAAACRDPSRLPWQCHWVPSSTLLYESQRWQVLESKMAN